MMPPVVVILPSGKIIIFWPFLILSIIVLTAIGFEVSTAICLVKRKNCFTQKRFAITPSTTNVISSGKNAPKIRGSKKELLFATIKVLPVAFS